MYITEINLKNYKIFENISLGESGNSYAPIHRNMNVIIGDNGAGKSAILSSIVKCVANFVYSIDSKTKTDHKVSDLEINNDSNSVEIEIKFADESECNLDNIWRVSALRSYRATSRRPKFFENSFYTKLDYKDSGEFSQPLPVVMNYGVERSALVVPQRNTGDKKYNRILQYNEMLNGKSDFRQFFEWVEDIENEENQKLREMQSGRSVQDDIHESNYTDFALNSVRNAIENFLVGFSNLRIDRRGGKAVLVDKGLETFNVLQLSQGERNLLALVGDIAKNLAIMYPNSENPLKENGVILIDEVDMHLHPSWQSDILDKFMRTFPNCQFFVTTHSPLVISTIDQNVNIIRISGGQVHPIKIDLNGWSSDSVLKYAMKAPYMDRRVLKAIETVENYLRQGKIDEANRYFSEIEHLKNGRNSDIDGLARDIKKAEFLKKIETSG